MPSNNRPSVKRLSVNAPKERKLAVVMDGGDFGAGLITDVPVITRGEERSYGWWVDETMLAQVAEAINSAGNEGIRVNATHEDDNLFLFLGRVKNARVEGDVCLADIHFTESSHAMPQFGDVATYLLTRTAEDPTSLGMSIAFGTNWAEVDQFLAENSTADAEGVPAFTSPDPLNTANMPHDRLFALNSVDVVGTPAANPTGMVALERQLAEARTEAAKEASEQVRKYLSAFGPEGATWFAEGKSLEECWAARADALTKQLAAATSSHEAALKARDEQIADLTTRLAAVNRGEKPLSASLPETNGRGLAAFVRIAGRNE